MVDVLVACSVGACDVVGTSPCWGPRLKATGSDLICPSGLVVGGGVEVAGADGGGDI